MRQNSPSSAGPVGKRPSKRSGGPERQHVYLITNCWTRTKIGRSSSPTARLSELQVGSHEELKLWASWPMDRADALAMEGRLHAAFAWAHVRGEWFDLPPRTIEGVAALLIAGREADAMRVAVLLGEMRRIDQREAELKQAWRQVKPRDRAAVERARQVESRALQVEYHRHMIEALERGMPCAEEDRHWERQGGAIIHRRRALAELLAAA